MVTPRAEGRGLPHCWSCYLMWSGSCRQTGRNAETGCNAPNTDHSVQFTYRLA